MTKQYLVKGIGWPTTWGRAATIEEAIKKSKLPPLDPVHLWEVSPEAEIDSEGELQAVERTYLGYGDISTDRKQVKNLTLPPDYGLPQSGDPGQDSPSQLAKRKFSKESSKMTEAKKVKPFSWINDAEVKLPNEKSKRRVAYNLIAREEGASYAEISEATGWNDVNAREGVRLLHRQNGVNLVMGEDGRIKLADEDHQATAPAEAEAVAETAAE